MGDISDSIRTSSRPAVLITLRNPLDSNRRNISSSEKVSRLNAFPGEAGVFNKSSTLKAFPESPLSSRKRRIAYRAMKSGIKSGAASYFR